MHVSVLIIPLQETTFSINQLSDPIMSVKEAAIVHERISSGAAGAGRKHVRDLWAAMTTGISWTGARGISVLEKSSTQRTALPKMPDHSCQGTLKQAEKRKVVTKDAGVKHGSILATPKHIIHISQYCCRSLWKEIGNDYESRIVCWQWFT